PMSLHAQIAANKRKTWLLGALFLALFAGVGAAVGWLLWESYTAGFLLAAIIGVICILIMTAAGASLVMAMNGARESTSEDDYPLPVEHSRKPRHCGEASHAQSVRDRRPEPQRLRGRPQSPKGRGRRHDRAPGPAEPRGDRGRLGA